MPLVRMSIQSVVVGEGPIKSLVVLCPQGQDKSLKLPICIGRVEAASISLGLSHDRRRRPMTHDLLANTIQALSGSLRSVSLTRVEDATFYATIDIDTAGDGTHHIDARPSDAIALAIRGGVPILASDDVLEQAGVPNFEAIAESERERELSEFHDFVENLSPEDFSAHREQH